MRGGIQPKGSNSSFMGNKSYLILRLNSDVYFNSLKQPVCAYSAKRQGFICYSSHTFLILFLEDVHLMYKCTTLKHKNIKVN